VNIVEGVGRALGAVSRPVHQCHVNPGAWSWHGIGWTDGGHVGWRWVACCLNRQQWMRSWSSTAKHRYQLHTQLV